MIFGRKARALGSQGPGDEVGWFAFPAPPGSLLAGTGFGGEKVLWIGAPRYRGPVLIRGGQIGGRYPVKFIGTSVLFPELQFPPQRKGNPGAGGWRQWATGTAVRAAGCYAWRVDGTTFSYTVVFRAALGR
jgi:hypothetical protein